MSLLNLTKAQAFCIYELMEIVMVHKNKDFIFVALQVVALSLKSFNNSQKLLVISLVAGLGGDYFLKAKDYKVSLTNFGLRRI